MAKNNDGGILSLANDTGCPASMSRRSGIQSLARAGGGMENPPGGRGGAAPPPPPADPGRGGLEVGGGGRGPGGPPPGAEAQLGGNRHPLLFVRPFVGGDPRRFDAVALEDGRPPRR